MHTRTSTVLRYFLQGTFVPLTGAQVSNIELAPFMTNAFKPDASMADFVNAAFLAAIGVGAMLAVLQLARAGMLYMGSDMWHKKEQARHLIQDAVIGLLLLLSVWIVLNQINPQILNLDVLNKVTPVQNARYDTVGTPINNSTNFGGPR